MSEEQRRPRLVLVGGFLGAGKTTLLAEAARRLAARGRRVGLVTNDQAPDLVDTALLQGLGEGVEEVTGSCFCCDFDGFLAAVGRLVAQGADTIVAEPVGSCTDLSATILQPIKARHPDLDLAPLSVLVDPARVPLVLKRAVGLLHVNAAYILRKQLEEADEILLSKADVIAPEAAAALVADLRAAFPGVAVDTISTERGDGVDAWLERALHGTGAGRRVVDVDYDRYAEGEAVLGWLNAAVDLRARGVGPTDWRGLVARWLEAMHARVGEAEVAVGHLKVHLRAEGGRVHGNLTRRDGAVRVTAEGSPRGASARLVVNARVQTSPEQVEAWVREALDAACGEDVESTVRTLRRLRPGRPVPTHRYSSPV